MMLLYLWPMLLLVVGWIIDSLFRSLSKFNIRKLQCIQNRAAKIVSNTSRFACITPVLKKLHWLPVKHHSVFKIATLVYKFLHTGFPRYFDPYISSYSSSVPGTVRVVVMSLLFQSTNPLSINLSSSLVSFAFDAPTLWNALPDEICASPSLASSIMQLKTYLYTKAYPPSSYSPPGIHCSAWPFFCPWILKLVDCFGSVAP